MTVSCLLPLYSMSPWPTSEACWVPVVLLLLKLASGLSSGRLSSSSDSSSSACCWSTVWKMLLSLWMFSLALLSSLESYLTPSDFLISELCFFFFHLPVGKSFSWVVMLLMGMISLRAGSYPLLLCLSLSVSSLMTMRYFFSILSHCCLSFCRMLSSLLNCPSFCSASALSSCSRFWTTFLA